MKAIDVYVINKAVTVCWSTDLQPRAPETLKELPESYTLPWAVETNQTYTTLHTMARAQHFHLLGDKGSSSNVIAPIQITQKHTKGYFHSRLSNKPDYWYLEWHIRE